MGSNTNNITLCTVKRAHGCTPSISNNTPVIGLYHRSVAVVTAQWSRPGEVTNTCSFVWVKNEVVVRVG